MIDTLVYLLLLLTLLVAPPKQDEVQLDFVERGDELRVESLIAQRTQEGFSIWEGSGKERRLRARFKRPAERGPQAWRVELPDGGDAFDLDVAAALRQVKPLKDHPAQRVEVKHQAQKVALRLRASGKLLYLQPEGGRWLIVRQ